jgi:hypothetical protein
MCPALVTRDIVLARAAVLGDLLDRRANGRWPAVRFTVGRGAAAADTATKATKPARVAAMMRMSATVAPPEAVRITTVNTA